MKFSKAPVVVLSVFTSVSSAVYAADDFDPSVCQDSDKRERFEAACNLYDDLQKNMQSLPTAESMKRDLGLPDSPEQVENPKTPLQKQMLSEIQVNMLKEEGFFYNYPDGGRTHIRYFLDKDLLQPFHQACLDNGGSKGVPDKPVQFGLFVGLCDYK